MDEFIEKVNVLMESLPYIKKFYNKTIVIKYGGSAMIDQELKEKVILDVILMNYVGIKPVIVHGGGKQITELMQRLGKEAIFIDGLRVTDKETMNIAEMVLTGMVNKEIVALINKFGGNAVGISGKDGRLIEAKKKSIQGKDYGFIGDIEKINPKIINILDSSGFIPIVSPIGLGPKGETFNVNADIVAGKLAIALDAVKLVYLTDVRGVCYVPTDDSTLIPSLNIKEAYNMIEKKEIEEGMIPKVEACIQALENDIQKTHIIDGRISHSIILEIFTEAGVGTEIVQ